MKLLGRYYWKPILQIKAHLVAKTTLRTCTGTVTLMYAFVQNMLKQVEVLLHGCKLP